MEFNDRLKDFKNKMGYESQTLADKMNISPSLISLLESGKRAPSKNVLKQLEKLSGKDKIWWLHGIDSDLAYIAQREAWQSTKKTLDSLYKEGLISPSQKIADDILNVILKAINLDLTHIEIKRKYLR